MTYPTGTFLNVVINFAVAQNESAQVTMNWQTGNYAVGDPEIDAGRIAGRTTTWWSAIKPLYTNGVAYQGTTAYLRNLTGPAIAVYENPVSNTPGTATGAMTPQECAVCVSTKTGGAGRRSRGRMYLPSPAVSAIDTLGTLTTATKTSIATNTAVLLDSFTGPVLKSVLWSRTDPSLAPLELLKVGAIMDVQRRRRSSADEAYIINAIS